MASSAEVQPALPWANATSHVPDVGTRIEVKWCLTHEEDDDAAEQPDSGLGEGQSTRAADNAAAHVNANAEPDVDATTEQTVELEPKAQPATELAGIAGQQPGAATEQSDKGQTQADPEAATVPTNTIEPKPQAEAQPEQQQQEAADAPAGSKERVVWWGGTVVAHTVEEGKQMAVLKYDAMDGFAEETRHVEFVTKRLLVDGEDLMQWRLEGEESPESECEDEEDEAGTGGREVQPDSLGAAIHQRLERMAERFQPQIASLSAFQQSVVLQGWAEWCRAVWEKVESKGPELDEEDIHEVTRELKRQRRS